MYGLTGRVYTKRYTSVDNTTGVAVSFTGGPSFIRMLRIHVEGAASSIAAIRGNSIHDDDADFLLTWDGYELMGNGDSAFAPICGVPGQTLVTVKAPDASATINISVMALE